MATHEKGVITGVFVNMTFTSQGQDRTVRMSVFLFGGKLMFGTTNMTFTNHGTRSTLSSR